MQVKLAQIFGTVEPPPGVVQFSGGNLQGLSAFLSNILKLLIVAAGIFAVFNFILAGYAFLSAGDNPKDIEKAWAKIWQSLLGLTVAAGAFILAAIFGKLLFNDYNALLLIRVFGPTP
ncbi:hypothetical protein A3D00_05465 [Candidatus Woesebacteria bacterium RIFCSPHIGHO2_02_FULL_38_9]|uniref:Uncharacterized protein n=1 Tax=Candidatus Woesebacteria bacterium RIFCSPHIGHO2_01_FULL_39_28 TaxID=1802496 RepID=A0A1F7YND4_9BACT|nr:MAG: hypothetical protein A2627_00640 [Candidatus Woesebacteria bacterium RIFCSPHIGHO2_01_FULL_39_28]OGM33317.1 MAG: hypothetical protein A3D00_05465 [Candidatus Woesebacteria bacterium RIFCSPHIGHO2_02_FULL_38_9]OGM56681.1 MAG: hypothetical protein A3A50_04980 [Candidatus Woesebacteria bacterium RIFCSPLOWO2_01_FULL_38_20]